MPELATRASSDAGPPDAWASDGPPPAPHPDGPFPPRGGTVACLSKLDRADDDRHSAIGLELDSFEVIAYELAATVFASASGAVREVRLAPAGPEPYDLLFEGLIAERSRDDASQEAWVVVPLVRDPETHSSRASSR